MGVAWALVCEQAGKNPLGSETLSIGVGGAGLTALLINRCAAACARAQRCPSGPAPSRLVACALAPPPIHAPRLADRLARCPPLSVAPITSTRAGFSRSLWPMRRAARTFWYRASSLIRWGARAALRGSRLRALAHACSHVCVRTHQRRTRALSPGRASRCVRFCW